MSKRDHDPVTIDEFRGLYARSDVSVPPLGYMSKALNVVYSNPGRHIEDTNLINSSVRVRENFEALGTLQAVPVRFYIYKKSSGYRIIFMDETGNIYDSVSGTIIKTFASSATDFHGITINDRFYFTPHDRVTGVTGEVIWVYDPDLAATARKAGGDPATGTFTVAASVVNGNIEPGIHVMAISFVTNTGFRTKPALHTTFTAPTPRKKVSATVIPLGPAGTVERLIWMSHVVTIYDGNIAGVPLFLAYKIENNTATTLLDTIDLFDTQLISSADPYAEALHEIPAGTYLTNFDGRLVVCGNKASPHTLYISNPNEPENIDAVDGLRECMRGDGVGVKTTRAIQGNLIFWKSNKTGILRPNGDTPVDWPLEIIDSALGAEVYSVSEIIDSDGMFYGVYLVANKLGVHIFNGTYPDVLNPITRSIESLWKCACVTENLEKIRVVVDPLSFRVYVLVPYEQTTHWYMGDFSRGLNHDTIKWSVWNFEYLGGGYKNYHDLHIVYDVAISDDTTVLLAIAEDSSILRRILTDRYSTGNDLDGAIAAQIGVKLMDGQLRDIHIQSVKMVVSSSLGNNDGDFQIGVLGDHNESFKPDYKDDVVEKFFNYTDYFPETVVTSLGADLNIGKFMIFIKQVFQERADI